MEFFQVSLSEQDDVAQNHPVLAASEPDLLGPIFQAGAGITQDFPYLYYGQEDGRIACYIRSFPDASVYRGQSQIWSWNADLFTHPDFRRRGLAQALVEQQMQACDRLGMIWGGVFSSPPALRLYEKLGFTMIGFVPRLCALRTVTPFLAHHMPRSAAAMGNALYAPFYRARSAYFSRRAGTSGRGVLEEIAPEDLAALPIAEACRPETVHWDQSAEWVARRQAVRGIDRFFVLRATGSETPLAYAAIRQRPNAIRPIREKYFGVDTMTLTHFGSFAPTEVSAPLLVEALLGMFHASDAHLLEIIASHPAVEQAARERGMIGLGAGMSFKYYAPEPLRHSLPTEGPENFHLTHYMGNSFSFE